MDTKRFVRPLQYQDWPHPKSLPGLIPTARVVSSLDCAAHPDGLHFTPAGHRLLGQRHAKTMLNSLTR